MHGVFTSVAGRYDLMNDAMSLGIHRLWKDAMLDWLAPRPGMRLVDVAGGTGDIAFRFLGRVKGDGHATVLDMTEDMLAEGRRRAEATAFADRLDWVVGDAMALPFADASFDAYTISFGIRNVTRLEDALAEAFRVLRPGGRLMVLEFSRVPEPSLRWLYDRYSFNVIPALGQALAGDRDSYQYLVESIRRFPDQEAFAGMIAAAGFGQVRLPQPLDGHRRAALGLEALMRGPHNLWRLIRTGATFERTGAMKAALAALDAPPTLRVAARVLGWPFQWLGLEGDPSQPPILRALTALGPAYIKFGQLLSTRPDVVGPELAAELSVLQDKLPPFPMEEARAAVETRARPAARGGLRELRAAGRRRLARAGAPRDAARDRAGGRGQGAAAGDRARLPARRRRLPLRREHHRAARALRPAAAAARGDQPLRGGGAGRARPADGGLGRGRVRGQHRARPRLPGAGGDLAGLRPAGADARMGLGGQPRRRAGAARHRVRPRRGSPSG